MKKIERKTFKLLADILPRLRWKVVPEQALQIMLSPEIASNGKLNI